MNDLCIQGGLVVTPGGELRADIGVAGGVIREIGPHLTGKERIDAAGMVVLPGMVDSHVHIRGGVFSHREDFHSGTCAAAAGGVTTLLEMPVASPPASRPEWLRARREEARDQLVVDVGMYAGAGADNLEEIPRLAEMGAVAFKTFLMPPPNRREEEFYGLCAQDADSLRAVMRAVAATGRPLAVHAEDNKVVAPLALQMQGEGREDLAAWERSRPQEAEISAIKSVAAAAGETGCRVIVCHVSTPRGLELIAKARGEGLEILAESCPHYLLLDCESAAEAGVFARVKPPLRPPELRREMILAAAEGLVDFFGSDHAPYLREEKLRGGMWSTVDGIPSLELSLPLLLNFVETGAFTYGDVARMAAGSAAAAFGLAQKGSIRVGGDADLVLARREDRPGAVCGERLFTKSRDSAAAFAGAALTHTICRTLVRGKTVFADGGIQANKGWGRLL